LNYGTVDFSSPLHNLTSSSQSLKKKLETENEQGRRSVRTVDSKRVKEMIAAECKRQMVGLKEVKQMNDAYQFAFMVRANGDRMSTIVINRLARLVEPVKGSGYRVQPATFANMSHAVAPHLIDRALDSLVWAHRHNNLTTDEFVKEFLNIHPFADGNGRVAFLLYNILNNTLHYPDPLPDYFQA
jgi:hypothetical protein